MDDDFEGHVKLEIDENVIKLLKNLPSPESQNISLDDYYQDNIDSLTFDDEFMTPNNTDITFKANSETDPNMIDKIPVVDTSDEDSDFNEVFLQSVLHCSSPIQWSPQRIDCNKSQNLDQALQEMQQIHPQINKVVENRVCEVDTILAGIQSQISTPDPEREQAQALKPRLKKRHDYKKVNKKGFSDN